MELNKIVNIGKTEKEPADTVLCVHEVVIHFSKLLYKMGHYLLDTHMSKK